MSTLLRVSYIDTKGFVLHEWFPTVFTADDRVKELDTLGMEGIDVEEVEVPWDHLADLIHFLNNTPNSPAMKDGTMGTTFVHPDNIISGILKQTFGESDPNGMSADTPGAKLDAGKVLPWLCISGFSHALEKVAEVTTVGARKYSPNGWMEVENGKARYMEAFGRHMMALGRGEVVDTDTGAMHKAQMIWNLLASLELELRSTKE